MIASFDYELQRSGHALKTASFDFELKRSGHKLKNIILI